MHHIHYTYPHMHSDVSSHTHVLAHTQMHTHSTHAQRCIHTPHTHRATWEPDPNTPFQPPEHLREAIEQFESGIGPHTGLTPRPSYLTTPTPKFKSSIDVEFIIS